MRFFVFLGNLFSPKKKVNVHNPEHEAKSPLDQMVEDYIELAKFTIKKANIKDVEKVELAKFNLRELRVKMKDGTEKKLFMDDYIHHNDAELTERLYEIDALYADGCNDLELVREAFKKQSETAFKDF